LKLPAAVPLSSETGDWTVKPDVAIVVFGEEPYAEGVGDRPNVYFTSELGVSLLKKFKAAGIPTVSLFISGRAMWVNTEINLSDAFVAAWLPGSEGGGIADVLIADAAGNPAFDFTGKLSFSWPATAGQVEVNVGDSDYQPLFAYGYGLSYADHVSLPQLAEDPEIPAAELNSGVDLVLRGKTVGNWQLNLRDANGEITIADLSGTSPGGQLDVVPADNQIQEDTFVATWNGAASLVIKGAPTDFGQQIAENQVLEIIYQVIAADVHKASLAVGQGVIDVTDALNSQSSAGWQTSRIRLACFAGLGAEMASISEPMVITAEGSLKLQIASVKVTTFSGTADCEE